MTIKEVDLVQLTVAVGGVLNTVLIGLSMLFGHRRGKQAKRDVTEAKISAIEAKQSSVENKDKLNTILDVVNGKHLLLLRSDARTKRELANLTRNPDHITQAMESEQALAEYLATKPGTGHET